MGVSAVGASGLKPRTIRYMFFGAIAVLTTIVYLIGPWVAPGEHSAAADKCNEMTGADYRSYRLEWIPPKPPAWDRPHWLCKDRRDLGKPGKSLGWWVNPF
jgi:hypothetical protein